MSVGALAGACAFVATRPALCRRWAPPVLAWSEGRHAAWFGGLEFLILFETATLFDGVRNGAKLLWPVVKPVLHGALVPDAAPMLALADIVVLGGLAWLVRSHRGATRRASSDLH